MNSEEQKASKKKFINKKINVINDFTEIHDNVQKILKKNEEVIINYLERCIYTSTLSQTTKNEITEIFTKIDSKINSDL
jgi:predicted solute-binding protein